MIPQRVIETVTAIPRRAGRVTALLALTLLVPAAPQAAVLVLDAGSTRIAFSLDGNMHDTHGVMRLQEGRITFDPENGLASGRVVVAATSAETGNERRDKKMHKEVLESRRYPEISFEPRGYDGEVSMAGSSHLRVEGVLTLHGDPHSVTLITDLESTGDRMTGTARFTIPYVEWGIKDPSAFIFRVAKTVDIVLTIEGRLEP